MRGAERVVGLRFLRKFILLVSFSIGNSNSSGSD